jgi:hypothetical protein
MRGNAKTETLAQRVRDQRDLSEVRQEPALGLVVRMADIVPGKDGLAGQFATTGHGITYFYSIGQRKTDPEIGPADCRPVLEVAVP